MIFFFSLQLHAEMEKYGLSDFKLRWTETDGQTFRKEKKRTGAGIPFCIFLNRRDILDEFDTLIKYVKQ